MKPLRINVRSAAGSYPVYFSPALTRAPLGFPGDLTDFTGVFAVSSARVWRHWEKRLSKFVRQWGRPRVLLFDDRESAKTLPTVAAICRRLVRNGADRKALLVAIGGGVVGDVAGFVAASFLRGVSLIHIPTTLVAQVDSSIGGKTGVNLPEGKNLLGAFYPPRMVIADPELLTTLPGREYR